MRNLLFAFAYVATFLLPSHATADTVSTWTGGGAPMLGWSNPANWSPAVVPNNSGATAYDVVMPSAFVGLDISPTINSLTMAQGIMYAAQGASPTLGVVNDASINGDLFFAALAPVQPGPAFGRGSLSVGGNLTFGANVGF